MDPPPAGHEPVLLHEVLAHLAPQAGEVFVDCTIGRGGHAGAIAPNLSTTGLLIGLDVDPENLEFAKAQLKDAPCQVRLFHANFAELSEVLEQLGNPQVHGILADLGISTNQLFDEHYGLSFSQDMPLDMRLDPRLGRSAADLVNSLGERELADQLYRLAQERFSRRIARKIVEARQLSPIHSTVQLAEIVRMAIGASAGHRAKIDPATRTFLALRIAVNQELENLSALLAEAPKALKSGGRIAVISFQSMEDRMVKQAFRSAEKCGLMSILTKKPLTSTQAEIARNPRSRSAKMRVAQRM